VSPVQGLGGRWSNVHVWLEFCLTKLNSPYNLHKRVVGITRGQQHRHLTTRSLSKSEVLSIKLPAAPLLLHRRCYIPTFPNTLVLRPSLTPLNPRGHLNTQQSLVLPPFASTTTSGKMKILFLCTAHNSLSQSLYLALSRSHEISIEYALSDELMISAAALFKPNIILCPFLTT
jgi:hypothetical protein